MGQSELKTALLRNAESQARRLWESVEQDLADRRQALEAGRQQEQSALQHRIEAAAEQLQIDLQARTEQTHRQRLVEAEQALVERLWELAKRLLPELAKSEHAGVFRRLADELPTENWQTLLVNHADIELARRLYPELEIVRDDSISGGLVVLSGAGQIRLDNSLDMRLQRAWPELVQRLVSTLRSKVADDTTTTDSPHPT